MRLSDLALPPGAHTAVGLLVRDGAWQRLGHGLYATFPGPLSDRSLAAAATLHTQGRGVVTGPVAARALDLPWVPPSVVAHVLVPAETRLVRTRHVLVRRAQDHADVATWTWGPSRLAMAERAVVDGSRECATLRDVRGLVLGAVAEGSATPDGLDNVLDRGARGGTALCRQAVRDARRGAASPPEAEVADSLVGRGWPFTLNAELWLDGELLGRPDVLLLGTGVCGEVDSVERHDGRSLSATLVRHGRFDRAGLAVEHITPYDQRRDREALPCRLIARALDRRSRGLGEPAGLRVVLRGPVLR